MLLNRRRFPSLQSLCHLVCLPHSPAPPRRLFESVSTRLYRTAIIANSRSSSFSRVRSPHTQTHIPNSASHPLYPSWRAVRRKSSRPRPHPHYYLLTIPKSQLEGGSEGGEGELAAEKERWQQRQEDPQKEELHRALEKQQWQKLREQRQEEHLERRKQQRKTGKERRQEGKERQQQGQERRQRGKERWQEKKLQKEQRQEKKVQQHKQREQQQKQREQQQKQREQQQEQQQQQQEQRQTEQQQPEQEQQQQQQPQDHQNPPRQPSPLSDAQYHSLADQYIETLVGRLEEIQELREDIDCEYSAGVLTISFPPNGTYVLNKQPPNKQIWLSSPVSGPKRYDYVSGSEEEEDGAAAGGADNEKGDWVYLRDGSSLTELLREELGVDDEFGDGDDG